MKKSEVQIPLADGKILDSNKTVIVLIIGESARSDNFSLLGYERESNPLLKEQNVTALKAKSSTTYTIGSVNTILAFNGDSDSSYEPLPNYLQRHGVDVSWRTTNWGEPHLKVNQYIRGGNLEKECKGKQCEFDEVLLTNLEENITNSQSNKIFITLHSYTNHGPSYYERYPQEFEKFTPVCKSVDLGQCTQQSLINAYDNTVLYTDYLLNQTIEILKKTKLPAMMIYVSDHGESLGEFGLYLHGAPNAIAPEFQRNVPIILWGNEKFLALHNLEKIPTDTSKTYNQSYIFHTIVNAFNLETPVYDKSLDLLSK